MIWGYMKVKMGKQVAFCKERFKTKKLNELVKTLWYHLIGSQLSITAPKRDLSVLILDFFLISREKSAETRKEKKCFAKTTIRNILDGKNEDFSLRGVAWGWGTMYHY